MGNFAAPSVRQKSQSQKDLALTNFPLVSSRIVYLVFSPCSRAAMDARLVAAAAKKRARRQVFALSVADLCVRTASTRTNFYEMSRLTDTKSDR